MTRWWLTTLMALLMLTTGLTACLLSDSSEDDDDSFADDDTGDDDDDGGTNECGINYGANPGCDSSDEACQNAMMINHDRSANPDESDCAPAIQWDDDLAHVARAHSKDMCDRGFFDHVNPDGKDPFDRMADAGISFVAAGENIAYGTDSTGIVQQLEDLFMAEPECAANHRGNILNRDFTHVGVGVYHCGNGNLYLTQDFATYDFDDIRDDPHEYCD